MNDTKIQVPSSIKVPAVQFESNTVFQKGHSAEKDEASIDKYSRTSWMQSRGDQRVDREVIATLFASQGGNSMAEKLLAEDIAYRDLGSLTHTDLNLMGISNSEEQNELLDVLKLLPNQNPSYESILKLQEALTYNYQILNNAVTHSESLRSALSAANYKLKIMPIEDVIVGEKSFASRFVLEALQELKAVTDEIDTDLLDLEKLIVSGEIESQKNKTGNSPVRFWIFLSAMATVGMATMWFRKFWK